MKIFDISRELFSARVYPGDPVPVYERILSLEEGALCNLSRIETGSHSSTHLDAPSHFIQNGRTIDEVELRKCIGKCQVVSRQGRITAEDIKRLVETGCIRLLIKGEIELGIDAARAIAESGMELLGVEGFTVGTPETSAVVHRLLLDKEVVIVEALDLRSVEDGEYFLFAAPLKLAGLDGSPCRAVLIAESENMSVYRER